MGAPLHSFALSIPTAITALILLLALVPQPTASLPFPSGSRSPSPDSRPPSPRPHLSTPSPQSSPRSPSPNPPPPPSFSSRKPPTSHHANLPRPNPFVPPPGAAPVHSPTPKKAPSPPPPPSTPAQHPAPHVPSSSSPHTPSQPHSRSQSPPPVRSPSPPHRPPPTYRATGHASGAITHETLGPPGSRYHLSLEAPVGASLHSLKDHPATGGKHLSFTPLTESQHGAHVASQGKGGSSSSAHGTKEEAGAHPSSSQAKHFYWRPFGSPHETKISWDPSKHTLAKPQYTDYNRDKVMLKLEEAKKEVGDRGHFAAGGKGGGVKEDTGGKGLAETRVLPRGARADGSGEEGGRPRRGIMGMLRGRY